MHGNESAAIFDEAGEVLVLVILDGVVIGVEQEPIELGKVVVVQQNYSLIV